MSGKAGWTRVALGDVLDVVTEYWDRSPNVAERFVAGEHIDEGDLRIRRWGMTTDDLVPPTFNRRFRAGDVLFHSRNLKKLARPDFGGITGEKLFVLRSRDASRLLPELVPFVLQTPAFSEYVNVMWAGSTNKFLNKAPLLKFEFALPPRADQSRLSAVFSQWHGCVDAWRVASSAALAVRDALRRKLFDDATETVPLENCISFLTSGSRGWSRFYATEGDLFLRVGNLNSTTIGLNLKDVQRVTAPNDAEAARTEVREGDVLLGITGEAGLGLVALASDLRERAFISQHIAMIRPDDARFDGRFLAHALASPGGQRQVAFFNQATAKAGMTLVDVRRLRVPNIPLQDQRRRTDLLDKTEKTVAAIGHRCAAAKQGLRVQLLALDAG